MLENFMESLYEDVKDEIKSPDDFMNESVFIDMFFEPFKQAFDGFWSTLSKILSKYPAQDGIVELCEIIEKYYTCKTDDVTDVLRCKERELIRFVRKTFLWKEIPVTTFSLIFERVFGLSELRRQP